MSDLIFEKRSASTSEYISPTRDGYRTDKHIPPHLLRKAPSGLPDISELDVVRHYLALARKNFCVDTHFYPLGSCTMKYNPKVNERIAGWPFYTRIHPYQSDARVQGALAILEGVEKSLCEITGMDAFTLQPAAGAHGELTGILIVKAYHESRKDPRKKVIVPDSAHGTNPASAALCGYEVMQIKTSAEGRVDLKSLEEAVGGDTACIMITNPNTLGLFETDIQQICALAHKKGALMYYDGANLNALLSVARPGDMGFDVMHVNLHKTFSVPHGAGGPGSGPVGVKSPLEKFLPAPRLKKSAGGLEWDHNRPHSIGRMRSFYGNFGAIVRAYCYIRALGAEGLKSVSQNAILNANYIKRKLEPAYEVPFKSPCMHEFVLSAVRQKERGVRALDIAKRLLDYGIHAPTVYFPLIVEEAMMVEPTETESLETLDRFIEVMLKIDQESREDPKSVAGAPHNTPVDRIDEVLAAREPNLRWRPPSVP